MGYVDEFQLNSHDLTNENPGALAGATGAKDVFEATKLHVKNTPKRGVNAMSKWAKGKHKRVACMIGHALTLGTSQAWNTLLLVLAKHLTEKERVSLAWAALSVCTDDHAYEVASSILYPTHGEDAA